VSSFEDVQFAINGKYSKNIYENSNYYVFLVIFQTYKNAILRSVHSLLKRHTYDLLANYYLLPILGIAYLIDLLHSLLN